MTIVRDTGQLADRFLNISETQPLVTMLDQRFVVPGLTRLIVTGMKPLSFPVSAVHGLSGLLFEVQPLWLLVPDRQPRPSSPGLLGGDSQILL